MMLAMPLFPTISSSSPNPVILSLQNPDAASPRVGNLNALVIQVDSLGCGPQNQLDFLKGLRNR